MTALDFSIVQQAALDHVAVAAVRAGRLVFANGAFLDMFGLGPGALVSPPAFASVVAETDRPLTLDRIGHALERASSEPARFNFRGVRPDGTIIDVDVTGHCVDLDHAPAFVAVVSDVTEQQRAQKRLGLLAFQDPLTGLSNRALFGDRLRHTVMQARRTHRAFAIVAADLDGFKAVNDTHGHQAGDGLLQAVARRFASSVRETDTVARLGGDEFSILLPAVETKDDAARVAERVLSSLADPIQVGEHLCRVGASIGIAVYPDNGIDADSLCASADAALYESKRNGKNRYTFAPEVTPSAIIHQQALIQWTDGHRVGIRAIDEQHATLAEKVNRLGEALKAGFEASEIVVAIADLVAWTRHHFRTEERLMAGVGYAEHTAHAQEHKKLIDDLEALSLDLDQQSVAIALAYLHEWLFSHIETTDRPLARHLLAVGMH